MLSLTTSRRLPPASSVTAFRLRSTCANCATRSPGPTMRPLGSLASCPARKSSRPPRVTMPWLKPRGGCKPGGLTIVRSMAGLPTHELRLRPLPERLVEQPHVLAPHQERLALRLGFQRRDQIHVHLVVHELLGDGEREARALGEASGQVVRHPQELGM